MPEESQDRSHGSGGNHEIPAAGKVEDGVTTGHLATLRGLFESFNDSTNQLRHASS